MKELYITNSETVIEDGEANIELYGRGGGGQPEKVTVTGFEPHFYVRPEEAAEYTPVDHENIVRFEDSDFLDAFNQQPVEKVVIDNPKKENEVAALFDETFNTDIDFTDQFRIIHGVKTGVKAPSSRCDFKRIEPVEKEAPPRVLTFDIETDDRGEGFPEYGEARILSIVAHDSYTGDYIGFIDLEERGLAEHFPDTDLNAVEHPSDLGLDRLDKLEFRSNEKAMLKEFADYVTDKDFDLICGWNSDGFDTPFMIERMDSVGVNSNRLARGTGDSYVNWRNDPVIQGRSCYDLMDAWEDTKFTKVSTALDNAAEMELDDAKLEHSDKGFYKLYDTDTRKFLNYNTQDTHLTVGVTEASSSLSFKTALRDTIGLDFEDTTQNNEYIEMMIRRKLHAEGLVGPTADPPEEDPGYDGAYVFDAFNGLKENIVGIDLASLYPNTLWMLNASPETKLGKIGRDFKQEWVERIRDEGYELSVASNGVVFCLEEDGIMRQLVDDALSLKEHAGKMKQDGSLSEDEQAEWAEEYSVRKTIVNSIYGVLGWVRFFLYDRDIASAVTLTGQEVIKETARHVDDETVASVAYGDTDSNYIEFPDEYDQQDSLEAAQDICDDLNESVYRKLAGRLGMDTDVAGHHLPTRFEIELEMYASAFLQTGQKKFYAYVKTWKEGMPFDAVLNDGDGKLSISGYPCIKSNTAELTRQVQHDTLEAIVRGADNSEIRSIIHDGAKSITPGDPDWDTIGIPGGLGKQLNEYSWTDGTPKGASPRAAFYANKFLPECNFGEGETVKRVYLKRTVLEDDDRAYELDVIGFERSAELEPIEGELVVDVGRMEDTLIRNPMQTILEAVNVDVDSAIANQSQSALSAFC
jgi:DNA polymerase I